MKINLKKKVVLITGCSGKIGSELMLFFKKEGSYVYGIDEKNIKKKNFFVGDIANLEFVENTFKKIYKKHKRVDVLINNAAKSIYSHPQKRKKSELYSVINTNLIGNINLINTFLKRNKKEKKNSKIINIGSIYGLVSPNFDNYKTGDNFNSEIYGATKAGLIQLTKYYSVLSRKEKININSISPGGIEDKSHSKFFKKNYKSRVPLNRMGKVDDLIGMVAILSSEYSDYISGQNFIIDGGLTVW